MRVFSLFLAGLFFIAALLAPDSVCGGEKTDIWTLDVEGVGVIEGFDLARARADALVDALNKAVEQAVAGQLSEEVRESKEKILKDAIYTRAEAYIRTYKILGEYPAQDIYRIRVRATVSGEDILRDLVAQNLLDGGNVGVSTSEITVAVQGIHSYGDYGKVKVLLKDSLQGVRRVRQKSAAWGRAELNLAFAGTIQSLVEQLMGTGLFRLESVDALVGRIEVTYTGERFDE
ncbi:MAG: hypothetical protein JW950_10875 [Deltaproteobacteria bacterium]|nr:hypothetical protein [Deltaproteobacteria bacterium]